MRPALVSQLRRVRLTLEMLLGRRLVLFAILDGCVVVAALFAMLAGSEGRAAEHYTFVVQFPFLALGLPPLAGLVDVERRAGCLDLALSVPSAEGYFLRRVGSVCAAMLAQGWLVMLIAWLVADRPFPLIPALLQVALLSAFLGAVSLFWAVRLKSAGAVWLGSVVTVAALARWSLANPIPDRHFGVYGRFLPGAEAALAWLPSAAVLAASTALFFLYARRRLRRPETLIS